MNRKKKKVVWQLVRQFEYSTSDDNNLAPIHLWWMETMLKHK